MITTSNSPVKGSGIPNHYGGDLLHPMAMSGLSRVRTELFHLLVIQSLKPRDAELQKCTVVLLCRENPIPLC